MGEYVHEEEHKINNLDEWKDYIKEMKRIFKFEVHYYDETPDFFPLLVTVTVDEPRGCGSTNINYEIFDEQELRRLAKELGFKVVSDGD